MVLKQPQEGNFKTVVIEVQNKPAFFSLLKKFVKIAQGELQLNRRY
jgi:hypothetical protein